MRKGIEHAMCFWVNSGYVYSRLKKFEPCVRFVPNCSLEKESESVRKAEPWGSPQTLLFTSVNIVNLLKGITSSVALHKSRAFKS